MIEAALYTIPSDDRDTWVAVGMALKAELGDAGFDLWNQWSQQAASYKAADAKAVWRSIKERGGITIRTLYKLARDNGYRGDADVQPRSVSPEERSRALAEAAIQLKRRQEAAEKAADLLKQAEHTWHPYLVAKGFAEERGFVFDGLFLVPMRDIGTGRINSVQMIDAAGGKKFLSGGKAKGSVFMLGTGSPTFLCEGYATGLSVRAALRSLYSPARVVVCFSAANLKPVSERTGDFVVADNDESNAGRLWAERTGLPYWMPPETGTDANDYHRKHGLRALAEALNGLRRCRAVDKRKTLAASGYRYQGAHQ